MKRGHIYIIVASLVAVFIVIAFVHTQVKVVSEYGTISGNPYHDSAGSPEGQNTTTDVLSDSFDSFLGMLNYLRTIGSGSAPEKTSPAAVPAATVGTTVPPTPTPAIPVSTRVKPVGSITGGSGTNTADIAQSYTPVACSQYNQAMDAAGAKIAASTPIQSGSITVTAQVTVTYNIR